MRQLRVNASVQTVVQILRICERHSFNDSVSYDARAGSITGAIAVQIIDHELGVVRAFADVFAQVDLPKKSAVELRQYSIFLANSF